MKRRWQKPGQPVSKYIVPEPWPVRIREAFYRTLVCPVAGHKRPQKMYGVGACDRCGR